MYYGLRIDISAYCIERREFQIPQFYEHRWVNSTRDRQHIQYMYLSGPARRTKSSACWRQAFQLDSSLSKHKLRSGMNWILFFVFGSMLNVHASGEDVVSSSNVRSLDVILPLHVLIFSFFAAFQILGRHFLRLIVFSRWCWIKIVFMRAR